MRVSEAISIDNVVGFWILPNLATVEALSSELATHTWVWAVALHVALCKLATVVI